MTDSLYEKEGYSLQHSVRDLEARCCECHDRREVKQ